MARYLVPGKTFLWAAGNENEVLITRDKNMLAQQNLKARAIAIGDMTSHEDAFPSDRIQLAGGHGLCDASQPR